MNNYLLQKMTIVYMMILYQKTTVVLSMIP